jgi:GNAT superfamily N-acetyltransferase
VELEADVDLADGRRVHIRPILPSDAPGLAAAIAGADAKTLRLRFLGWRPVLDDATLRYLVEVDYQWRFAVVAFDSAGHGVAVARYEGRAGRDAAEIAVAVAPAWRTVGLGSRLLTMLAKAAVARGIRRFVAYYLADNHDVEGLVTASGLTHRSQVSLGVVETELDLPAPERDEQPSASSATPRPGAALPPPRPVTGPSAV